MADPTNISLTINGAAAGPALLPFLLAFEHADDFEKSADTLTLHFRNDDNRFADAWYIKKGSEIEATLTSGGVTLDCGLFFVDNSTCLNPPAVYVVKATSIPISGNFKNKKGGDAWEKITLKELCGVLAQRNGLGLDYRATENPMLSRIDQDDESDAAVVRRVASNFGLVVKVTKRKLTVIDEAEYDKQPPTFVFGLDVTPMISYEMRTEGQNKVSAIHSAYLNPATGQVDRDDFDVPQPPEHNPGSEDDNDLSLEMEDLTDEESGGGNN